MDFLPKDIENIILDYKYQMELKEKFINELDKKIEYRKKNIKYSVSYTLYQKVRILHIQNIEKHIIYDILKYEGYVNIIKLKKYGEI